MDSTFLEYRPSPCCFVLRGLFYGLWAKIRAKVAGKRAMSIIDALFTFLFNVCLPTWDVFTDLAFAYSLTHIICNDYYEPWQYYVEKYDWKVREGKIFFN